MRRAVAGIGIVVVASLFLFLLPVVPTSAASHGTQTTASSGGPCSVTISVRLGYHGTTHGYGSVTYAMVGRGGAWFNGAYNIVTSGNFSVSISV